MISVCFFYSQSTPHKFNYCMKYITNDDDGLVFYIPVNII